MLTIKQILKKSGLSLHNFQAWRRNDSNLLPRPIAVDKRTIYFDDSIMARIKFIQARQAEGFTLVQIEERLSEELARDSLELPSREVMEADSEAFMEETKAFLEKWQKPETCRDELIAALNLDPELSGQPTVFAVPQNARPGKFASLQIFAGVIFNGEVHLSELAVDLYAKPKVIQRRAVAILDYATLLFVLGREWAEQKLILKTEMVPYLIFHGLDKAGAGPAFWQESIEVAQSLTPIFEGGLSFLNHLRATVSGSGAKRQKDAAKPRRFRSPKKK